MAVLDGLRGIAVLIVILSHTSLAEIDLIGIDMAGTGKAGVWLFFVLSSFLLMHQVLLLDANGAMDSKAWGRYAVRRLLRIYPLYVVFLLVCWLAPVNTQFGTMTSTDVLTHLAVIEGRWHTWSIAVELKYYLLLPFLFVAYAHIARRYFLFATLMTVAGIGVREFMAPAFDVDALWTYVAIFLIGSWAAIAHQRLMTFSGMHRRQMRLFCGIAALAIFAALMAMTPSLWSLIQGVPIPLQHWHRSFTLFGLLWGALLICLLHANTHIQAVFSWLPLRVLGVVSFSAYLWHGLVLANLQWVPAGLGETAKGWLVFLSIVLTSIVSYLLIERPFLKIGREHGKHTPNTARDFTDRPASSMLR